MFNMEMSRNIPIKPGFYWWTNFGEHTPCILHVELMGTRLYASNEEYGFEIEYDLDHLWSTMIPFPIILGEEIKNDYY